MTTLYRTKVTATFEIEVEADSFDEAERIVDGVLENRPTILLVEGGKVGEHECKDVLIGPHGPDGVVNVLSSDAPENVLMRGSMHRRLNR